MLEEIVGLVESRLWARIQIEVQEAIRTLDFSELPLVGVNPMADLTPAARGEVVRLAERLETGKLEEAEEIRSALRQLSESIRPVEFTLMLEGHLPMSEAGFLCRELETLLDPGGGLTPTPADLRAAASVSWMRLWAEFEEDQRRRHTSRQEGASEK